MSARGATGLALAALAVFGPGCAGRGCRPAADPDGVACRAALARESLVFGMSREDALARMGNAEVAPPWRNDLGLGPTAIRNPYDTREITSAIGEKYELTRYFVKVDGDGHCPLVRGRLDFEPLIFFEGELVGWTWGYLEGVLAQPVGESERVWRFGEFCGRAGGGDAAGATETTGSSGTE